MVPNRRPTGPPSSSGRKRFRPADHRLQGPSTARCGLLVRSYNLWPSVLNRLVPVPGLARHAPRRRAGGLARVPRMAALLSAPNAARRPVCFHLAAGAGRARRGVARAPPSQTCELFGTPQVRIRPPGPVLRAESSRRRFDRSWARPRPAGRTAILGQVHVRTTVRGMPDFDNDEFGGTSASSRRAWWTTSQRLVRFAHEHRLRPAPRAGRHAREGEPSAVVQDTQGRLTQASGYRAAALPTSGTRTRKSSAGYFEAVGLDADEVLHVCARPGTWTDSVGDMKPLVGEVGRRMASRSGTTLVRANRYGPKLPPRGTTARPTTPSTANPFQVGHVEGGESARSARCSRPAGPCSSARDDDPSAGSERPAEASRRASARAWGPLKTAHGARLVSLRAAGVP